MMENYDLAEQVVSCLSDGYDDEEHKEETVMALYEELADISDDSFLKAALTRLCERIEELEA